MKKILATMGLLGLCLSSANAEDFTKLEFNNIEIQTGKFYEKTGVAISSTPFVLSKKTDERSMFTSAPHVEFGVQEGGDVMFELSSINMFTLMNDYQYKDYSLNYANGIFYMPKFETFTSKVSKFDRDEERTYTEDKRYSDVVLNLGYSTNINNVIISAGAGKGIFSNVDLEKFVEVDFKTFGTDFVLRYKNSDLGHEKVDSATISFTYLF